MFEQIYHLANALWPVWGMILFLGIVAYAFWPSNKAKFERHGQIPLDDEKPTRATAIEENSSEKTD